MMAEVEAFSVGSPTTPRLPLANHPIARSRSLDEAAEIQGKFIGSPVGLVQLDRGAPFSWMANRLAFDRLGIMASHYGAGIFARESRAGEAFHLVVCAAHGGRIAQGRQSAELRPGVSAALCSPGVPVELALSSQYQGRVITIPAGLMESTFEALTGAAPEPPLRFDLAVDLRSGAGRAALSWLDFVMREVDHGEGNLLSSAFAQSRFTDVLLSTLLGGLSHNQQRDSTAESAAEPQYVKRAEEYLAANACRHVSLTELARAVGIGVRALGAAFRTHRGYSPMRFLQVQRLELARLRLLASPARESTVTEIALSCGFEHLGRFSVAYRARFGESPSATAQRRQPVK